MSPSRSTLHALRVALYVGLAALLAGCGSMPTPTTTPMPTSTPEPATVEQRLARMTLDEKVGQIMIVGFAGPRLTPELRDLVRELHIGGVIVFLINGNIETPEQVSTLTRDLQDVAREDGAPGLFMAIDQEGGRVSRLREATGFSEIPSAMALGASGDPENARRAAQLLAREMLAVGLNVDFAPVLDVNNNPANPVIGSRSFGSDPESVAEFGVAFLEGLQSEGVLAFGKHFPGHGDTDVDSHVTLPTVPHDRARLESVEFVPFRAAIAADLAGIMSAHVTFPAIDPSGLPATLSRPVLTGLLRRDLGFDGLVVTDSLEMGALKTSLGLSPAEAAATALAAGADLLLFNQGHDDHRAAHALIVQKVAAGEIPLSRLDDAVARVLRAKERFGLLAPVSADPAAASGAVFTNEHRALADALAAQSITLLRDDARLIPLGADAHPFVFEIPAMAGLGALLGETAMSIGEQPTHAEIRLAAGLASQGRPVLVGVADVKRNPTQIDLVDALVKTGAHVIVVALREPYDLLAMPAGPTLLATYGSPPPSLRALNAVLRGETSTTGRLPVELPGLFPIGSGLTR